MNLVSLHSAVCPSNLYIHYPVCKHACSYCDFIVISQKQANDQFGDLVNEKWVSAITSHFRNWHSSIDLKPLSPFRTIYFGGGTPSLLRAEQMDSVLSQLKETMGIERNCEITVEANPETITAGYLKGLRHLGVNRLSIGIQTTRPSQLRRLERLSTRDKIFEAVDLALKYFENVNLDLMIGIPEQTEENLFDDLEFISKTKPQHMSVYILTLEPDHIWYKSKVLSSQLADAETVERLYVSAINFLTTLGYEHYEVSNFAQPGFASKHNKNYWDTQSSYLALGPGAHGYLEGVDGKRWRTVNHRSIEKFFQSQSGLESFECLTTDQRQLEELYMRLRTRVPLSSEDLGISQYERRAEALIDSGLAVSMRGGLVLTDRGWLLMEKVAEYLV